MDILEEIYKVVITFTNKCRLTGEAVEIFETAFETIKKIYNELLKRGFDPVFIQNQHENVYLII